MVGLSKEIQELKRASLTENKERSLIEIPKNAKGYRQVDPLSVDTYYSLLEECFQAQFPETLNIHRWRKAFVSADEDSENKITLCNGGDGRQCPAGFIIKQIQKMIMLF